MVELNIYRILTMGIIILLLWLSLMLFALYLAFMIMQASKKTQSRYQANRRKSVYKSPSKSPSQSKIPRTRQWRELLTLVHGDVGTAQRLVESEQRRNPSRNIDWCVEKALWQLQRDRRY